MTENVCNPTLDGQEVQVVINDPDPNPSALLKVERDGDQFWVRRCRLVFPGKSRKSRVVPAYSQPPSISSISTPVVTLDLTVKGPILLLGDCLERLREIPGWSVDFSYITLPYGITGRKWDCPISFPMLWEQLHRVMKPGAAMAFLTNDDQSPNGFPCALKNSNPDEYWNTIHWVKPQATGPLGDLKSRMEDVHIFVSGGGRPVHYYEQQIAAVTPRKAFRNSGKGIGRQYNQETDDGSLTTYSGHSESNGTDGGQSNVWFGPQDQRTIKSAPDKHETPNPPELAEFLVRTFTPEPEKPEDGMGSWVLDATMGCASTGVGTVNCGRRFIGCEKDPKWYDAATRVMAEAGYAKHDGYCGAVERFGGFQHEGMYYSKTRAAERKCERLEEKIAALEDELLRIGIEKAEAEHPPSTPIDVVTIGV